MKIVIAVLVLIGVLILAWRLAIVARLFSPAGRAVTKWLDRRGLIPPQRKPPP